MKDSSLQKITICAEYVWIGGNGEFRSKIRCFHQDKYTFYNFPGHNHELNMNNITDISLYSIWNYDGSSTEQADGNDSEVILKPVQVWIHPFDCRDEIELLKDFLGLKEKEVRLIVSKDIGEDDWLKNKFKLK